MVRRYWSLGKQKLLYGTKPSAQVGQRAMIGNKDILFKENTLVLNTCIYHGAFLFHISRGFKLPIWSTIANLKCRIPYNQ